MTSLKKISALTFVTLLSAVSNMANAGDVCANEQIKGIWVGNPNDNHNTVIVNMVSNRTFVMRNDHNLNDTSGQGIFSTLMTAYTLGHKVQLISHNGDCSTFSEVYIYRN